MLARVVIAVGITLPIAAPMPRPVATLELVTNSSAYRMTVQVTTESGATYALPVSPDTDNTEMARDQVYIRMVAANWLVDSDDHFAIRIYGVRAKGNKVDPIRGLVVSARRDKEREIVKLSSTAGAKVELQEGDGKPVPKAPPVGPDLGQEPYVEFDFGPIPELKPGGWKMTLTVLTADKDVKYTEVFEVDQLGFTRRTLVCGGYKKSMTEIGFKAEVVDDVKLRVYGCSRGGRFYPAAKGAIEPTNLKKGEWPKVTNPPKA